MSIDGKKVLARHPDPGKQGTRIDRDKYVEMRRAILRCVPRRDGMAFRDLPRCVEAHLSPRVYAGASVTWYCVTVKLDLEARGEIERVPGKRPQHLRRIGR